ncbi:MAG: YggS family pyridoxal phosphate-dependent enzyme [Ferruginibacter sp.]
MSINIEVYHTLKEKTAAANTSLVAVSKLKPVSDIQTLYDLGHRDFGENYVQELMDKAAQLPQDIRWHFIGHLQSNKVKYIASFVHLIHGIDSEKLLTEVNKQAAKHNKIIACLLQVHIAQEETKFGFDAAELKAITEKIKENTYPNVLVEGLMGMASFSDDVEKVAGEFNYLKLLFDEVQVSLANPSFKILSMGMSGDYELAIYKGSNMIRVGSLLFGKRG